MNKITADALAALRDDLAWRRMGKGMEWLEAHRDLAGAISPASANAAPFLGFLAQWTDAGYPGRDLVEALLARFGRSERIRLSLGDYAHVRMTEGFLAMSHEDTGDAIRHFDFVVGLEHELEDSELLAITHFWKARCRRKRGEYESALADTVRARDLALGLGYGPMAAVMQVLESWLWFQRDRGREAARILRSAEETLHATDDYIALGNIQSAFGRMARRAGRYDEALRLFQNAIDLYGRRDAQHRNLARSLANMAHVERLLAVDVRGRIDAEAERRRKTAGKSSVATSRDRFDQLRKQCFAHLEQAAAIYRLHDHHHGSGTVLITLGYLHLDTGDLDRARNEAAQAYQLGEQKNDAILMARARILQCAIENDNLEQEIGEGVEPGEHAQIARLCADEAVELAGRTQNASLQAHAFIWRGLTQAGDTFNDLEGARASCDRAAALLRPGSDDPIVKELNALRARILQAGSIDATLLAWSQGVVGHKTFSQVSDDFAALIIPKIWEREGRKVSRVAAKLKISPKKVRRILHRKGLL